MAARSHLTPATRAFASCWTVQRKRVSARRRDRVSMSKRSLVLSLSALALASPAAALADGSDDGVFVDPGSPSGKEYAIPIESARRDAASGSHSASGDKPGKAPPLFGVGVKSSPAETASSA